MHAPLIRTRIRELFSVLALLVSLGLGRSEVHAGEASAATVAPGSRPTARAVQLAAAPVVDGRVLDDPAWQGVEAITGFWQTRPSAGAPATQRTDVYVGYTEDALYIAAVLHDDQPDGIIAASSRRDANLEESDSFLVVLDSFRDRQNGFVFGTNPAGVEYDGQLTKEGNSDQGSAGGSFNLNWDTTWAVKTATTEYGWVAEMMIPFRSLRYGREELQTWGVNFQRGIRRNNEIAYWAPLDRQHDLYRVSQAGTIAEIRVPAQRNLKFTPYVLGQASRGGLLTGTDFDQKAGFDLKYSITPSLTLDATYNTDFAQVEADELQLNLDRFSLFIPERRPFFLENADRFSVGVEEEVELFFSRRIGIGPGGQQIPIEGGMRVSGRVGASTNLGLLQMRSEEVPGIAPQNDYTVVRIDQGLPGRSSFGLLAVNRNGDGSHLLPNATDYNRTYAVDGRWGMGQHIQMTGFFARTDTPGLTGRDRSFALQGAYSSEYWTGNARYTEVGDAFNPEVGFLSRTDYRKFDGYVMRRIRPENLWGLHELRPHIAYRGYWDFNGFQKTGYLHVDNHWEWRNGNEVHTGVNFTREGVTDPFRIVTNVTVPRGTYDHAEAQLVYRSNPAAPVSGEMRVNAGGYFGGNRVSARPTLRFRTGEKFSSELSLSHNRLDLPVPNGSFDVNLVRVRLSYSFSPRLLLQGLMQYDDQRDLLATNVRFAWLQSASTGLYLVYSEVDDRRVGAIGEARREFIVKYSRIFDLLR